MTHSAEFNYPANDTRLPRRDRDTWTVGSSPPVPIEPRRFPFRRALYGTRLTPSRCSYATAGRATRAASNAAAIPYTILSRVTEKPFPAAFYRMQIRPTHAASWTTTPLGPVECHGGSSRCRAPESRGLGQKTHQPVQSLRKGGRMTCRDYVSVKKSQALIWASGRLLLMKRPQSGGGIKITKPSRFPVSFAAIHGMLFSTRPGIRGIYPLAAENSDNPSAVAAEWEEQFADTLSQEFKRMKHCRRDACNGAMDILDRGLFLTSILNHLT